MGRVCVSRVAGRPRDRTHSLRPGAAARFRDSAALLFAPLHLVRDLAWVAAIAVWSFRRRPVAIASHAQHGGRGAPGALESPPIGWPRICESPVYSD